MDGKPDTNQELTLEQAMLNLEKMFALNGQYQVAMNIQAYVRDANKKISELEKEIETLKNPPAEEVEPEGGC